LSPLPTSIYTQDPGSSTFRILGIEPVLLRRIVHLGWPVIIGMLSQTAINTVDLLFIGRLPEEVAVPGSAAIFLSVVLIWVFGGFLSAISVGTQAISARRFSEGSYAAAGKVLTNSLAVAMISSAIMFVCVYPFAGHLITLLSVQDIGESYVGIRFFALAGMATMAAYKSFYDGLGRVRVHMTIAIFMNILNVCLCYLLIFGFSIFGLNVPAMGIDGAALAAVISSYFGLALIILWSLRREDRSAFGVYRFSNLDKNVAGAIVKLSVWSGFATVVLMAGVGLFSMIVGEVDKIEGLKAVNSSAASIITHIMMLVFMTCLAFGTSTATLVSQCVGAKQFNLASRYGWQSVLIATYVVGGFGLIAFFFPEPFLRIFMPHGVDDMGLKDLVVSHALPSMKLAVSILSPLAAAAMVLTQALYGAGKTRYVLIVEFLLHFGVLVPLAYFLAIPLGLGLLGCWLAGIAYALGLLIATGIKFAAGGWKETVL
jgi:MATE family multidrug resistance protein